MKISISGS